MLFILPTDVKYTVFIVYIVNVLMYVSNKRVHAYVSGNKKITESVANERDAEKKRKSKRK